MPDTLDQLTVSTRRYVRENPQLVDNFFARDPLLAYAKLNAREDFTGGYIITENIIYDTLPGAPYLKGAEFNITEKQVEQQKQFNIKYHYSDVTMSKEDIQVLNKGNETLIFRLIDGRLTVAYIGLATQVAIFQYMNGINANYLAAVDGMAEAINDGINASWDGNIYPTYGTLTRNGVVGPALNSTPTSVTGAIEYNTLESTYANTVWGGDIQANLGVTTNVGYSYIKEKFQTQQRFNDTQDPNISFNGMKFNGATLIRSRYAPGSEIAQTSPQTSANKAATYYLSQMTGGAVTTYPQVTNNGETLWWVNARKPYYNFYVSDDPEFGFGLTGFKPAQGNTKVAAQALAACQFTFDPRYHAQVFGFTG